MSPNEREWGTLTAQAQELDHKVRNQRMLISALVEEVGDLRSEIVQLRIQIKTAVVVLSFVISGVIWLVEVVVK